MGSSLTYLMGQLWELNLDLLPLEHVVLCLFTDGRDLVELPRHRVRLLQPAGTAVTVQAIQRSLLNPDSP